MQGQTLAQIRTQAKYRADMQNSAFVTDPEWLNYINGCYAELYEFLVATYEDYYTIPTTLTIAKNFSYASLPADFFKEVGVDLDLGGGQYVTLTKFQFNLRNIKNNSWMYINGRPIVQYRIVGDRMEITPTDSAPGNYRMWYIPVFVPLVDDTDTTQSLQRWDDYIAVGAAIKALTKEESSTTHLDNELAALKVRIQSMAQNRDAGMPDVVQDIDMLNARQSGWWGGGM